MDAAPHAESSLRHFLLDFAASKSPALLCKRSDLLWVINQPVREVVVLTVCGGRGGCQPNLTLCFCLRRQDDEFPPRDDFNDADQLRVGNDGIFMLAFFSKSARVV